MKSLKDITLTFLVCHMHLEVGLMSHVDDLLIFIYTEHRQTKTD